MSGAFTPGDPTGVAAPKPSPWWWLCSVCGHRNTGTGVDCGKCVSGEGSAVAEPREKGGKT